MKNKLTDLRDHLFATLEQLTDPDPDVKNQMTLEKAKVVADVAQVVINSAKIEVEFLKVQQNAKPSEFFPTLEKTVTGTDTPARPRLIGNTHP